MCVSGRETEKVYLRKGEKVVYFRDGGRQGGKKGSVSQRGGRGEKVVYLREGVGEKGNVSQRGRVGRGKGSVSLRGG